jgi:hypothetical protein
MRPCCQNKSLILLLAAVPVMVALTGCGRSIRALDTENQIVSNKHRTATVNTEQFEVSATWVPVPWATGRGPIGFHLEIANAGKDAAQVDIGGIILRDGWGRLRGAIPPDKLLRAFSASAEPVGEPRAMLAGHCHVVRTYRHYDCYYPRPYAVYAGYGYGWGYGPPYYYYGGDPYYEQREIERFLAELLESQTVPPGGVASGFVVFPCDPEKDDELTVEVDLGTWTEADPAASQPAAVATVSLAFEVR